MDKKVVNLIKSKATILRIRDGMLDIIDKEIFDATYKEADYLLYGRDQLNGTDVLLLDLDKRNIRPYAKDLINRMSATLEVKLHRIVIMLCGAIIFMLGVAYYFPPVDNSEINTQLQATLSGSVQQILTACGPESINAVLNRRLNR